MYAHAHAPIHCYAHALCNCVHSTQIVIYTVYFFFAKVSVLKDQIWSLIFNVNCPISSILWNILDTWSIHIYVPLVYSLLWVTSIRESKVPDLYFQSKITLQRNPGYGKCQVWNLISAAINSNSKFKTLLPGNLLLTFSSKNTTAKMSFVMEQSALHFVYNYNNLSQIPNFCNVSQSF